MTRPESVIDPIDRLETERLVLRRFRTEDWRELQDYVSRPEVWEYDFEYPTTDEGCQQLAEYFAGQAGIWAVCLTDGQLIGHVVSNPVGPADFRNWDIGFVFSPNYAGSGYATEACARVLEHDFDDLGVRRIESHCHPDNDRSWRLLERLGMRREGHHVKDGFLRRSPDGEPVWCDTLDYAILKDEWQAGRRPT